MELNRKKLLLDLIEELYTSESDTPVTMDPFLRKLRKDTKGVAGSIELDDDLFHEDAGPDPPWSKSMTPLYAEFYPRRRELFYDIVNKSKKKKDWTPHRKTLLKGAEIDFGLRRHLANIDRFGAILEVVAEETDLITEFYTKLETSQKAKSPQRTSLKKGA